MTIADRQRSETHCARHLHTLRWRGARLPGTLSPGPWHFSLFANGMEIGVLAIRRVLHPSSSQGLNDNKGHPGQQSVVSTTPSTMPLAQCDKCQGFGDRELVKKCPDTTKHPFWWPKNAAFFTSDRFFHKLRVPKRPGVTRNANERKTAGLHRSIIIAAILLTAVFAFAATAQEEPNETQPQQEERNPVKEFFEKNEIEYHGFYEARIGTRLLDDPYQSKDLSIGEARYQFDLFSTRDWGDVKVKGDAYGDFVEEQAVFDLREANIFLRPTDSMDLKFGRQVLTWGTGDLIFINDVFPKDWVSFFIGRDTEYLKAPSDAVKVSLFSDAANLDVVYTPEFDSDRYITGERLSYFNPILGRRAGEDDELMISRRREFFEEDETALRLYRNISNYELALYGYWGYWKSPAGFEPTLTRAIFPELYVYGASVRGTLGKGIANAEIGYYDSLDDRDGDDPLINNSELRYLLGYTQEIARDFTAGVQYYVEQMLDYGDYEGSLFPGSPSRDEFRHVVSLRLTQLLMNQNLTLSLFTYYSPSDEDVYARPMVNYKASDQLMYEVGSNVFFGDERHTFFNQFHYNTNVYVGVRYSF